MNSELKITSDGSHTLFVPEIDECYHSSHGAIQESRHIFIEAALKQCVKTDIRILEVGFGTGLNALLAFAEAKKAVKRIHYTTLEKFPVSPKKALLLNFPDLIDNNLKEVFEHMHGCNWNELKQISPFFEIEKLETDFTTYEHTGQYDVIFFDAFSPEKQPEMWTEEQFRKIAARCNPRAILTTYCAKGAVRRAMQAAGFTVERLPGPPGKREILRGTYLM
ncbi:MAG TPA: tRNA (5-methylaminomethyl-2-thiouridine)(34)-methyltransferase MnmD [Paludibacter sp.]